MDRTYLSTAMKGCLLILLSLVFASRIFAGTCPSGANYLNTTNPAGPLVTLSSLGITNCYFIAANGSDTNNGTSESTPWLHAPGMTTCTGNCASNTPTGGTGYIFRGGDTWHEGNSSLSPYTNSWTWSWSGSSTSSPIYIGVDPTWYSGSSWVRPILNGDNSLQGCAGSGPCPVSSCTYQAGSSNTFIGFSSVKFYILDDFEMTGLCWSTNGGAYTNHRGPSNVCCAAPSSFQNLYIHGWTYTTAGTQAGATAFLGASLYGGSTFQYNIVDGSDSDDLAMNIFSPASPDGYIVQYNVFRHVGGSNVPSNCHILHDNIFEYFNNVTDGSAHTDVFMCYGEANDQNHPADGTPNLFYNNTFRYIGTEYSGPLSSVFWEFPPGSPAYPDYVFNNVFHDYYGEGTNYNNFCEGGCYSGAEAIIFNNTEEAQLPSYNGCIICNGSSSGATILSTNNHWITNNGTTASAVFQSATNVTELTPTYQTYSTATGQGYAPSNDFAPTASTNATVTASGTNETSGYCAAMSSEGASSYAVAACEAGTTDACSYNSTNHTISCPDITAVARPSSGAWNIGAYQFSSTSAGTPPAAPTNLAATVN